MAQVKITVRPNGPFRVEAPEGAIELVDVNGTPFDLTGKTAFSLCRCGGSVNKPFCDGTHSKIGFQGAELAVKKAEGGCSRTAEEIVHDSRDQVHEAEIQKIANWECIAGLRAGFSERRCGDGGRGPDAVGPFRLPGAGKPPSVPKILPTTIHPR